MSTVWVKCDGTAGSDGRCSACGVSVGSTAGRHSRSVETIYEMPRVITGHATTDPLTPEREASIRRYADGQSPESRRQPRRSRGPGAGSGAAGGGGYYGFGAATVRARCGSTSRARLRG